MIATLVILTLLLALCAAAGFYISEQTRGSDGANFRGTISSAAVGVLTLSAVNTFHLREPADPTLALLYLAYLLLPAAVYFVAFFLNGCLHAAGNDI